MTLTQQCHVTVLDYYCTSVIFLRVSKPEPPCPPMFCLGAKPICWPPYSAEV